MTTLLAAAAVTAAAATETAAGPAGQDWLAAQPWSFWVVVAVGVAGIVATLWKVDDQLGVLRKAAFGAAVEFEAIGLTHLATLCREVATNDATGLAKEFRVLIEEASRRDGVTQMAADVVCKTLPALLKNPVHAPAIRAAIAEAAVKPAPPPAAPPLI